MSQAEERLRAGEIDACLEEVMADVRSGSPSSKSRVLLFQLFCVTGQWERARRQLYILKDLDASTVPMFETYDPVIQCEMFRLAVFSGERDPLFLGEPGEWLARLASALPLLARGDYENAARVQGEALDDAPETPGTLDGSDFEWIADADSRLGPVLEVFLNGRYFWVPFDHIARIRIHEPEDLRDLVWTPVDLVWSNGGETVAFVPTRYPGSETASDDRLRLSRMTDWDSPAEDLAIGVGQRLLLVDGEDRSLLSTREIVLRGGGE